MPKGVYVRRPDMKHRTNYPISPPCKVEGCDKKSTALVMCKLHYERVYRNGHLQLLKAEAGKIPPCSVADCGLRSTSHGWCWKHYCRFRRHGDLETVLTGANHPLYTGDLASISAVHRRLVALHGKAADHGCVDCGGAAKEWSYDNADPDEKHPPGKPNTNAYSLKHEHYQPRCVSCHRYFDAAHRKERRRDLVAA